MSWFWFALGSAFFAALVSILAKVGITGVHSNLATAVRTIVIVIFAWGISIADGSIRGLPMLSGRTLLFLILSGIATGASWLLYFRALQLGSASSVAPIDKLSLVLTIILAVIFLHEKPTIGVIVGTILITAGTLSIALWK